VILITQKMGGSVGLVEVTHKKPRSQTIRKRK
jgi:hypothetical protein